MQKSIHVNTICVQIWVETLTENTQKDASLHTFVYVYAFMRTYVCISMYVLLTPTEPAEPAAT